MRSAHSNCCCCCDQYVGAQFCFHSDSFPMRRMRCAGALSSADPIWFMVRCIFLGFYLAYRGILSLPSANTAIAFLAATLMWFSRFSVSVSVGLFALATLTPSNLTSALRRLKLPQWLTIPPVVFLRIVPVILAEARAIYDAMQLRGLRPGVWSWIRRPVQSSGMFMIPLLGAVMRVGDELAAAALIRGLGGESYPTTVTTLRFRVVDAGILSLLLVTVSSLWWSA